MGGKKNVLLCPPLSSPHSEHKAISLLRKYSNISRKVLDLLWVRWGHLRLRSGLTPACTCFQSPQSPPRSTDSS